MSISSVSVTTVLASTPLDDFLSGSSSSDTGQLLQRIGLFGSLFGVTLTFGLLVFLAVVHRGSRAEVATILRIVALAGGATVLGAAVEIAGLASLDDVSWWDAVTHETGSASMMRLVGGLLVVLGLFEHTSPTVGPSDVPVDPHDRDEHDEHDTDTDDDVAAGEVRWVPASASAFGMVGAVVGIVSFWFDGHTVTHGPRVAHALVDLAHVVAGSIWFGGIVGLCVLALGRRGESIAPVILRFSSIAAVALILAALSGSLMVLMVIDGLGDIIDTEWGRLLLVKVAAVGTAAIVGGYNHFVVVPSLEATSSGRAMVVRARATVAVEAVVLAFVVAVTVFLTGASVT